jgi:protein TonB
MTSSENPSTLSILTSVLWCGCLVVGVAGVLLPYAPVRSPPKVLPPIRAELLNVRIAEERSSLPPARAPANPKAEPPPAPDAVRISSDAPRLMAVVAPNSTIAFSVPVAQAPHPASVVQKLTYGQGEGQQPAPEYPRESVVARQQGVVVVRFVVGADGEVLSAEAVEPSPWPLLNQAALRAVSQTWRFAPGQTRSYEVSIQFQLRQRSS